jgi:hypothetical protein
VNRLLGIETQLRFSHEFDLPRDRNERLVELCRTHGAQTYISGPAAGAYLDCDLFARSGIEVEWFDYSGYPEYPQFHPPFVHRVSVVDLLFHTGPQAAQYLQPGAV